MRRTPDSLSKRPRSKDGEADVVGELLDAAHLTTVMYGRLQLGAPWHLAVPARPYFGFYVVARGGGWIALEPGRGTAPPTAARSIRSTPLSAGDMVLFPHGSAHRVRDTEQSRAAAITLEHAACPRPWIGEAARFGSDGPLTTLVTGHFAVGGESARNPLLATLPAMIHIPADATAVHPELTGIAQLILSESARPGPGASLVLARLADLLLIHALRYYIKTSGEAECGLHAVADPAIGTALQLVHARPGEPWTVERLAHAVSMSRSAFAARFTALVGEPPLQYLARWRMTRAARLLAAEDRSIAAIASEVGYANAAAFTKAFTRYQGMGPGTYRRKKAEGRGQAAGV